MNILTMFLTNIPNRESSYNSSQAHILKSMLEETGVKVETPYGKTIPKTTKDDTIYLYHGFGFDSEKPKLNVFGGLDANGFTREHLVWLTNHQGKIVSLEYEFPDLLTILLKKIEKLHQNERSKWDKLNAVNFASKIKENNCLIYPNGVSNKAIIGDSHAYSIFKPGFNVNSVPHKTLHGALKENLMSFLPGGFGKNGEINVIFGNIDVRHHLCRYPIETTINLAKELVKQMNELSDKFNAKVNYYEPLPIENESRKMAKTGWFKGTPFYGTWDERNTVRNILAETVKNECSKFENVNLYKWTDRYLNKQGELDFKYMEGTKGVHLNGEYFPHWRKPNKTY